jgi:chromate reductase
MTQILGIPGSLRKASHNTSLLRTASDLAPDDISIQVFDLSPLPLYNDDLAKDDLQPAVSDFRNRITSYFTKLLLFSDKIRLNY